MPIGTLNEGPLHAALKATYVANGGDAEVAIEGFVADAVRGGVIYEVQTGSFSGLTRKMQTLSEQCPVVLVHPIAATTHIIKVSEQAGQEAPPRRKSPKHGRLIHIVNELVYIPTLLNHPNFSVEVVLTEEEELRRYDPNKNRRRGGWRVVERRLLNIVEGCRLQAVGDLFQFVQRELPDPFTSKDLAGAINEPVALAQKMAYCFRHAGETEIVGKQGNSLLYTISG
ncbi:MAG: hypothetical protein P8L31_04000 [Pseudomonadales bacterium]|nr:hypothetical protein [Pseudomonadales bacterium]